MEITTAHIAIIISAMALTFTVTWQYFYRLNRKLERIISDDKNMNDILNKPVVQYEKIVYDKMIHLQKKSDKPTYKAYIERLDDYVDVFDEKFSIRINKFSKETINSIRDRSSGEIDMMLLHPFSEKLKFTDRKSRGDIQTICQDLFGSDLYINTSSYYNGFQPEHEDLSTKMEVDTAVVRFISDFTSIPNIEKIFTKEPILKLRKLDGSEIDISDKLNVKEQGLYVAVVKDVKQGEVLELDFDVDWNYLK